MLKEKDVAPTFTLQNQDEQDVSLSDYLGKKVVLYFYPKDNTPGCTQQACAFRDYNEELKKLGVVVLGISKDSVNSHRKFVDKHDLNFTVLADSDKKVHELYDVLKMKKLFGKEVMGTERSTFIIDEKGYIKKIMRKVSAKDNPKEVFDYINSNS